MSTATMPATVRIRQLTDADRAAVLGVVHDAFGEGPVPEMVTRLWAVPGHRAEHALLAEEPGRGVVGYVMLTPITLEPDGGAPLRAVLCLTPLAVHPDRQRQGIGRALVEAALEVARRAGEPVVLLEGDPALYARFGFVAASTLGLRRPSERIPERAFQAYPLAAAGALPPGRVLYPELFWELDCIGLPVTAITWLDLLERTARRIEEAVADLPLDRPLPSCPGWTAGDLLRHLGSVHRLVDDWIGTGRRPVRLRRSPGDAEVRAWFAAGWRRLHERLDELPPDEPAPTWCPWDASAGFWRRRMAHEIVVHGLDLAIALPPSPARAWLSAVEPEVALDGVDEVLRLWLGTKLGTEVGGGGAIVRVEIDDDLVGGAGWTVGLHDHLVEVHSLPDPPAPDAVVRGSARDLYAWLWGRAGNDSVELEGSLRAVRTLRNALSRATR